MADETVVTAPKAKADFHLIVVHPFDDYQRGQKIDDAGVITDLEAHHLSHHCRKVFAQG